MIFEGQPNAPSTAHGARSAAATQLRRSRCCDGAAQTSFVALILRVASRRDALNEEPASFPPGCWPTVLTVLGHPVIGSYSGSSKKKKDGSSRASHNVYRGSRPGLASWQRRDSRRVGGRARVERASNRAFLPVAQHG